MLKHYSNNTDIGTWNFEYARISLKGGRMMVTQKDIHNSIVVNASDWQKNYLSLQCGGNVEKIKEVEQNIANMINGISKALENSGTDYLNKLDL